MKYNAALFTTLAVSMASVRAAPSQEHPPAVFKPSDPFVACVRKTHPNFPKEGKPTTDQLRACFPGAHPHATRELVSRNAKDDFGSAIQSRGVMKGLGKLVGLADNIQVLGKLMGLDQKSACQDKHGLPTSLHDEFVWIDDVADAAAGLCNDAMGIIDLTGLSEDGGVAYASKQFDNAHDDQDNNLKNGRHILFTMAIGFFPPLAIAKEEIKDVATGVRNLCSASVLRLLDSRDGCTAEVGWYISQKAKFDKHLAAVGGQLGLFFDGTNNNVATIKVGFSEDSNYWCGDEKERPNAQESRGQAWSVARRKHVGYIRMCY